MARKRLPETHASGTCYPVRDDLPRTRRPARVHDPLNLPVFPFHPPPSSGAWSPIQVHPRRRAGDWGRQAGGRYLDHSRPRRPRVPRTAKHSTHGRARCPPLARGPTRQGEPGREPGRQVKGSLGRRVAGIG